MDRMTSTTARQHRRTRLVRTVLLLVALAAPALLAQPAQAQQMDTGAPTLEGLFADMSYRNVGPSRGGRVTAVAGHRDHPFTFYMGAVGGGVWKTENYGTTWRPISDGYFATGSIGSIRVAPSNSNIVYVGTGSDGIRSNVIVGRGAYRSDDAGETWTTIGLEQMGQIGAIENAIRAANLGLNPGNDGRVIRIPVPPLTDERRKELSRLVHRLAEEGRNSIRQIRRDANDALKKLLKNHEISEDDERRTIDEVQKITNTNIQLIDELQKSKDEGLLQH